jgi:ribosomal protein S19
MPVEGRSIHRKSFVSKTPIKELAGVWKRNGKETDTPIRDDTRDQTVLPLNLFVHEWMHILEVLKQGSV